MDAKSIKTMNFEESLGELEAIVRQLEEGKIPLEDAVKAYERGAQLRQHCEDKLAQARLRIEKISTTGSGEVAMVPFDEQGAS